MDKVKNNSVDWLCSTIITFMDKEQANVGACSQQWKQGTNDVKYRSCVDHI